MEYTIKLTQQEVQTICMALGEIPLKLGINVLGNIQKQAMEQDTANAVDEKDISVG